MKRCIACGAPLWETPLLTLDNMPASAQNIPAEKAAAEEPGLTLDLCQCSGCGLVQFDCDPAENYRAAIRADGYSDTVLALRRYQYKHLIETYHLRGKRFIEVGCGRGEFLKVLTEYPVEAHGLEYDPSLAELAGSLGLSVEQGYPETEDAVFEGGIYDVFLCFNYLEHQPDPNTLLQAIYRNLDDDGIGLITVPSFEYIMDHNGYYELTRDHIAYYTFDTLASLLERNGFQVLECEMLNRDTLSMVVKKRPQMEAGNLLDGCVELRREIDTYLKYLAAWKKKTAVWGMGHQSFTLAATTRLGEKAEYMINSAPFQQGGFVPSTHLPIVAPEYFFEHPVETIVIAAPGYTDEIARNIEEKFGHQVEVMAVRSNHLDRINGPARGGLKETLEKEKAKR